MRSKTILGGLFAAALLSTTAYAQTAPSAPKAAAPAQAQSAAPLKHAGEWRASKLVGVNVYNQQNEKIGDINEILLDQSGKVSGVIIGVGGFLGMGEHDVLVKLDQIRFMNEPIRSNTAARPAPVNTTGTGTAANTRPARAANEKWYPDHAVMNTTKDQLKALPAFKYSNYN